MTPGDSRIEAAREAIAEKLRGQAWLDGVPVLTHQTGNLDAKLNEELGKLSLVVVVGIVSAREGGSGSPRVDWKVKYFADLIENVPLGSGGPGAWAYAEAAAAALKLCALADDAFPEIADDDLQEIAPPREWEDLLIVRIPLTLRITGNTRQTTD